MKHFELNVCGYLQGMEKTYKIEKERSTRSPLQVAERLREEFSGKELI